MKLNKIKKITGKIVLKTGLHIGAGDTELRIGGTDNPVVKHPYTDEPYIPGSSIKGKVRSLLELDSGLLVKAKNGAPLGISILKRNLSEKEKKTAEAILKLFGVSGGDSQEEFRIGPARASFGDATLSEESRQLARERQLSYFEIKSENSIDRIRGTAQHPRFMERVVAGLEFDFSITFKEMEGDDVELLQDTLLRGLKLLEHDALGGSGSRGYGRVSIVFGGNEESEEIGKRYREISLY